MSDYCVVIGGVNVDIGGKPDAPLIDRDSNPGRINSSLGGVGRNIAHNLSLMGIKVVLITALGKDANATRIIDSCRELNIDIDGYYESSEDNTSSYLFITDEQGDMTLAVSDMNIYRNITPEYISGRMDEINGAKLVIVDANLPSETIEYIAKNCTAPVFADPVSCTKAVRLLPALGSLYAAAPNLLEAEILTDTAIKGEQDLRKAAEILLNAGMERVFITLGEKGLYAADKTEQFHFYNYKSKLVNATGAGDAMLAGIAYSFMQGHSLSEMAHFGLAAAAIAIEGKNTINEEMSITALINKMKSEDD